MPYPFTLTKIATGEQTDLSAFDCECCKGRCICGPCDIKDCASEKKIDSCAECETFPCEMIVEFSNDGKPHHHAAVENLKSIRENGIEKWFASLKPELRCPCGERQTWYYSCREHQRRQDDHEFEETIKMIQDIAPHVFDNQYRPQPPATESYGLCFDKNTVLVRKNIDGTFDLPNFKKLAVENTDSSRIYLFSIDNRTFYLLNEIETPENFTWQPIAETMKSVPRHLAFAIITGYQLHCWYENRKYCGRCGSLTVKDEKIRFLSCPSCKQVEFPKIAPAVIIGVIDGNRLLLASYPKYDKFALLAGFVEIGETLEETIRREVMEEVGLKVKNIRYYKSQPWPVSDNLLAGFFCDVDGSDEIAFDADELADAQWIERKDIHLSDDYADGSLTYEMMCRFKSGNV